MVDIEDNNGWRSPSNAGDDVDDDNSGGEFCKKDEAMKMMEKSNNEVD